MKRLAIVLLFLAGTSAAQEQLTSVVVPVVGNGAGPNAVRWKTDVELRNDMRQDVTITLMLPTVPDQPVIITSIPAGESLHYTDIVAEAFGLEAALSPLLVTTTGRRSVTVRATAYGTRGAETLPLQPIAVNYGSTYFALRALPGLSFNDAFRTNIGLANLSEREAVFVLALQRLPGRNLAVARIPMPPSSLWHAAIQQVFPLIREGENFTVVVETNNPETHVYASVIENTTNIAKFVQPTVATQRVAE